MNNKSKGLAGFSYIYGVCAQHCNFTKRQVARKVWSTGKAWARCRGGHCALNEKWPGKQGRPKWSYFKQMDDETGVNLSSC